MQENGRYKDNGGRMIFENATLCSQFLSEYTGVELFKDLKPEDIEDMTERFLAMFTEERASDVVEKINLRDKGEMYVIGTCSPCITIPSMVRYAYLEIRSPFGRVFQELLP